ILATLATSLSNRTLMFTDLDKLSAPSRKVLLFPSDLSLSALPLEDPTPIKDDSNLFGCLIMLDDGVGLCGNMTTDIRDESPGRIALNLTTGKSEFHQRETLLVCRLWRLDWTLPSGKPVLSLSRLTAD